MQVKHILSYILLRSLSTPTKNMSEETKFTQVADKDVLNEFLEDEENRPVKSLSVNDEFYDGCESQRSTCDTSFR